MSASRHERVSDMQSWEPDKYSQLSHQTSKLDMAASCVIHIAFIKLIAWQHQHLQLLLMSR